MKMIPTPEHGDKIILADKTEKLVCMNDDDTKNDTTYDTDTGYWQVIWETEIGVVDSDINYLYATWSDALQAWVEVDAA